MNDNDSSPEEYGEQREYLSQAGAQGDAIKLMRNILGGRESLQVTIFKNGSSWLTEYLQEE